MRALACGGMASALGLVTVSGCGGRTSTLDPNAYGSGSENPGEYGGSSTSGGRPNSSGASGGGSVAVGGSGTPAGVNPSLAVAPCSAYCPGYGTQCLASLNGQDCMTACQLEVNSFGERCQKLGIAALQCLAPFFTPNGANCDAAVARALTKCVQVVNEFQACKASTPPTPKPTMPSMPSDAITSCPLSSMADSTNCTQLYACSDGVYFANCSYQPGNPSAACTCTVPNGSTSGSNFPNDGMQCARAARELCQ